jgi:hypothetical protein
MDANVKGEKCGFAEDTFYTSEGSEVAMPGLRRVDYLTKAYNVYLDTIPFNYRDFLYTQDFAFGKTGHAPVHEVTRLKEWMLPMETRFYRTNPAKWDDILVDMTALHNEAERIVGAAKDSLRDIKKSSRKKVKQDTFRFHPYK